MLPIGEDKSTARETYSSITFLPQMSMTGLLPNSGLCTELQVTNRLTPWYGWH
jgi:hypothetical protein